MSITSGPFADLAPTAAEHFRLHYLAAAAHVVAQTAQSYGGLAAAFEHDPFLAGYHAETASREPEDLADEDRPAWWADAIATWERGAPDHLPLKALREGAGLEHEGLSLLMGVGLIEEDARFGLLFEGLGSLAGQHRPTLGLLSAWWRDPADGGEVRARLRRLREMGLVQIVNPDAPRIEWALQVPGLLWDALRGEIHERPAPWLRHRKGEELSTLDEVIAPASVATTLGALPALLASSELRTVVVRGPRHNGRRTALGALARALGRGVVEAALPARGDDDRWRLLGPLATLLHALPVVVLDLAPGETAEPPALEGYAGPVGIVLGREGGLGGPLAERAVSLSLPVPDAAARRRHWSVGPGSGPVDGIEAIAARFRMTAGNVRRAAGLARAHAALAGRAAVRADDVRHAARALNRQALDTLATPISCEGDWSHLALPETTAAELRALEARCRHRERLAGSVGPALKSQLTPGVRALFSGPSGTGKTLAARTLAAALGMDLYRLDLAAVVNKYIGETEKSLDRVFSRAEELDVVLLLDEGDALMTRRTQVVSSNDRYANLETNFLLQRLEGYEGILLVTTNASDRIDGAFRRRMDAVVEFQPPEASERWSIWLLHLPSDHAVDPSFLGEVAGRCDLSGGAIRNAVLHATLLALEAGGPVTSAHVDEAVRREYRKTGAICPLRGPERGDRANAHASINGKGGG